MRFVLVNSFVHGLSNTVENVRMTYFSTTLGIKSVCKLKLPYLGRCLWSWPRWTQHSPLPVHKAPLALMQFHKLLNTVENVRTTYFSTTSGIESVFKSQLPCLGRCLWSWPKWTQHSPLPVQKAPLAPHAIS